ncbi:hypothetical protein ACOSP7_023076 [Xanthoceras sorbifolium]|uniref:WEB family protein n=1 Tax=Xanthoceras sorbifolium TaxID=99658 RepID=A0ABQ8HQH4_9ROSI|nr:hypothetical protein JRO89_XS08G0181100 [Xanthoceras sorbifolium]
MELDEASYLQKARKSEEICGNTLEARMAQLVMTKEELKTARDCATQSWLDSKPLIDELETLKAALASAKNCSSMSNIVISDLESELETTSKSIRSKKEEELKARRMIDQISRDLDQTREELESLKLVTDEERRARSKLKQVQRLRKQTLRTLQLKARAVRIESEAFRASAAEALRHIKNLEMDSSTVQLTHQEYYALTRRANEETSLADWRISVSMEQKHAAEASNSFALSRLKDLQSGKVSRRRRTTVVKKFGDGHTIRDAEEEQDLDDRVEAQVNRGMAFPKARAKLIAESGKEDPPQMRSSISKNNQNLIKKRKPSIFHLLKRCIVRKLKRLFR